MKNFSTFAHRGYFGAANGFTGFRHSFDKIFSPAEFEKIFILKGGPGTGKSSLMQRYAEHFHKSFFVEAILCSSDSDSLDGVIVYIRDKKIAIIDGTAPHEIGLKIPGVKDEIINLGDNWNERVLESHTKQILELNYEKKLHYKQAYDALRIAGEASEVLHGIAKSSFNSDAAVKEAKILISGETSVQNERCGLLIGAFNKNGLETIPISAKKSIFKISGKSENSNLLMDVIYAELTNGGRRAIKYQSPLKESLIDAIETPDMLFVSATKDAEVCSDEFEKVGFASNKERYMELKRIEENALILAKDSFFRASEVHKSLEEIYKTAMDFEKNEAILEKLIERTDTISKK